MGPTATSAIAWSSIQGNIGLASFHETDLGNTLTHVTFHVSPNAGKSLAGPQWSG